MTGPSPSVNGPLALTTSSRREPAARMARGILRALSVHTGGRWRARHPPPVSGTPAPPPLTPPQLEPGLIAFATTTSRCGPGEAAYLRREAVTGPVALDWVRARYAETVGAPSGGAPFEQLRTQIREVPGADGRTPCVAPRGGFLSNFWRRAAHPRGLWRLTTL